MVCRKFSYLENVIIMNNMYAQILEKFLLAVGGGSLFFRIFPTIWLSTVCVNRHHIIIYELFAVLGNSCL